MSLRKSKETLVVVVVVLVSLIGCTNAPLVATSHAANRTHFLPAEEVLVSEAPPAAV